MSYAFVCVVEHLSEGKGRDGCDGDDGVSAHALDCAVFFLFFSTTLHVFLFFLEDVGDGSEAVHDGSPDDLAWRAEVRLRVVSLEANDLVVGFTEDVEHDILGQRDEVSVEVSVDSFALDELPSHAVRRLICLSFVELALLVRLGEDVGPASGGALRWQPSVIGLQVRCRV